VKKEKNSMKKVSRFLVFLIVLAMTLGAVGCQPKQQAGPVTVHVLTMEQAGPTVEEMNAIVDEFNKANPNVEVLIDYVSYDALHDKITTAMASDPPAYDVFLVDDIWYAEFADKGYILDVTDRISQDAKDKVFAAAWDITTVKGKIYGFPWLLDLGRARPTRPGHQRSGHRRVPDRLVVGSIRSRHLRLGHPAFW
jgi:multiple sugar transport system substrate-binding protein